MAPIDKSLRDLAALAAQLNERSDALNERIGSIEDQLAQAGVGVTLWLYEHLLDRSTRDKDGEFTAWCLGYSKVDADWRVAVKRVNAREYSPELFGEPRVSIEDLDQTLPLLKAPRVVRLEAAPLLEELVQALAVKVQAFIETVDASLAAAEVPEAIPEAIPVDSDNSRVTIQFEKKGDGVFRPKRRGS